MSTIDSLLDIFQNVNTTRKQLVESLYVDEACYNEEIDDKLNEEKFEGVYPYSYILGEMKKVIKNVMPSSLLIDCSTHF